jgi:hypothetical protein
LARVVETPEVGAVGDRSAGLGSEESAIRIPRSELSDAGAQDRDEFGMDRNPFLVEAGRHVSWSLSPQRMSWYEFTLLDTDIKWPQASPNHRRGIAEALTDASEAGCRLASGSGARRRCP